MARTSRSVKDRNGSLSSLQGDGGQKIPKSELEIDDLVQRQEGDRLTAFQVLCASALRLARPFLLVAVPEQKITLGLLFWPEVWRERSSHPEMLKAYTAPVWRIVWG